MISNENDCIQINIQLQKAKHNKYTTIAIYMDNFCPVLDLTKRRVFTSGHKTTHKGNKLCLGE